MKKLSTLHILNGDASLPAFETAGLPGGVLVWREILSEGPAVAALPEERFWQLRQDYITAAYHEASEHYRTKVLQELPKLAAAAGMFEVVLWFDADLMCQVNLLYLLHRLHELKPTLVSVCTPPPPQQVALMQGEALAQLFRSRQQLSEKQLAQAHEVWQLYAGPDPLLLQQYIQAHALKLPYLHQAQQLHLSRFPSCTSGLGQHEHALLALIRQEPMNKEQLMKKFWQQYPGYGFGDLQLAHMLQRLEPLLLREEGNFQLSSVGFQVLQRVKRYSNGTHWLGGTKLAGDGGYCYQSESHELKKSYRKP